MLADRSIIPSWTESVAFNLPLRLESGKLGPRYIGPFKILKKINPVSYRLLLPRSMCIHPTFHVSCLKPVIYSPFSPVGRLPPVPWMVEGQLVYSMQRLLNMRKVRVGVQYLVTETHCTQISSGTSTDNSQTALKGTSGAVHQERAPVRLYQAMLPPTTRGHTPAMTSPSH